MIDREISHDPEHLTLHQLGYRNETMVLQAGLYLNPSVNRATAKHLLLVERGTGAEVEFPFRAVGIRGECNLLEAEVDVPGHPELLLEGAVWDLYICVDLDADRRKYRLESNNRDLELLFFCGQDSDHFLVPYTTIKGNVSFSCKEKSVVAKVENAGFSREGVLTLEGYALNPVWKSGEKDNIRRKLIFKNEAGTFEKEIEVRNVKRTDLSIRYSSGTRNFDWVGFRMDLDLKNEEWFPTGMEPLGLYAELELDGARAESDRLEVKYAEAPVSESSVAKTEKGKKKYAIRNNKDMTLSFSVSEYGLIKEMGAKAKRQWLRFKDSSNFTKGNKMLFKAIGSLPVRKNLVIFESFSGKQYSCNPRAIYEYLQEHHPEYKAYWSVNGKFTELFERRGIPYARRFSLKWLWLMPRARYWVINARMPAWIPKPKHTEYLQTWHGTPLKKLAADMGQVHMPGTNSQKYKKNFLKEAKKWDYLISPNAYSSVIFWRAFQFDQTMIESGYPRNDYLFHNNNPEAIDRLKERCGLPLDKKVILYAPTWRDDQFHGKGRYKFDLDLDLNQMREQLEDEYVVILRMHYLVAEQFDLGPYEGFAYDFSTYEDIRDLYLISDLLITDYSSVFFDYANLKRPIIFYVYDIDRYRDTLRGFYFDIEEQAPGPLVKTTDGVIEAVRNFEDARFALPEAFEAFYNQFCYLECGESSRRVVERVFREERPVQEMSD
ncbi:MAG TPA: CDP-glycerol glycerophosphotransferase family protein [Bacillales bacterium]|nr:CDP-glycerol glycerophosphotransferase family protein [Bacillales bacterium]